MLRAVDGGHEREVPGLERVVQEERHELDHAEAHRVLRFRNKPAAGALTLTDEQRAALAAEADAFLVHVAA